MAGLCLSLMKQIVLVRSLLLLFTIYMHRILCLPSFFPILVYHAQTARDFGTLIPEIKGYCRDFAPNINLNPKERIAIMRKNGNAIRLQDYFTSEQSMPNELTFGLAWDVTNGVNIDLDASAICLDSNLNVVDIISYKKLGSDDHAILHFGDEREGDAIGDDEMIRLNLNSLNPTIAHIAFVINSFSGQELDDVSEASCHLFDTRTRNDLAYYNLSDNKVVDKKTALLMASLFRENGDGQWCMRIIGEPAMGRVASQVVSPLQYFLKNNPPVGFQEVPEPEIIVNEMPEDVEIAVEAVAEQDAAPHDTSNNVFVPPYATSVNPSPNAGVSGAPFVPSYS